MSQPPPAPFRFIVPLLVVVALALPATNLAWFDGLPFAAGLEALGVVLLLPALCARALRDRWLARLGGRLPVLLAAVLLTVIGAKAALWAWGEPEGWRGCYTWRLVAPPLGACEVSYDNPLQRFGATRLDRALDFGRRAIGPGRLIASPAYRYGMMSGGIAITNWNFSFLNSLRFNFYEEDGTTERLPFAAAWRGAVASPAPTIVRIDYLGEGRLRIGAREQVLPASYDRQARVEIALPATGQPLPLELRYVYDDGGRRGHGAPPLGRQAELHLTRAEAGAADAAAGGAASASSRAVGTFTALRTAPPALGWRALAWLIDGGLLLVIGSALAGYAAYPWFRLFALAVVGLGALAWLAPSAIVALPAELFLLAPCALLLAMLARPEWRSGAAAFAIVCVIHALRTFHDHPDLATVLYRAPGLDWLAYEGFARNILESRTLEGGEAHFYLQPGWRYLLFALRLVWGDNDILFSTFHAVVLTWGLFFAFLRFVGSQRLSASAASVTLGLAALLVMLLANIEWVVTLMRVSASETASWLVLAPMAALLFAPRGRGELFWGSLLASLSLFARVPQLPGVAWALAMAVGRRATRGWRTLLLVGLPPCLVPLAILLHNYAYAGRLTIAPASAHIPQNVNLYLTDVVSQPLVNTLAVAIYQLRMIFFLPPNHEWPLTPVPIGWALLALWGWTLAMPLARRVSRSARHWALLLWPAAYLLPYLSWNAANYYPRHILIAYLAIGVAIVATIGEETLESR